MNSRVSLTAASLPLAGAVNFSSPSTVTFTVLHYTRDIYVDRLLCARALSSGQTYNQKCFRCGKYAHAALRISASLQSLSWVKECGNCVYASCQLGRYLRSMISNTQNKQASAQQHSRTAFNCSAAFDLSGRIQGAPCMARLRQYRTHTIIAKHIIKEAHMRSGSAGRPNMYRGLLISPDALRISTYRSPPCRHENPHQESGIQTQ